MSLVSAGSLPLLELIAVSLVLPAQSAQADNAESVAQIAQAITVRIEGAVPGSGVLVKREGSRYTVLTAWHVVSDNRPGEEVAIYTPDGKQYQMEKSSIRRVGDVDLALLTFFSTTSYELARLGDDRRIRIGSLVYVSGFPRPSESIPIRIFRFLEGKVIANSAVPLPNGYQLVYSNQTLPGMSGGAVLNSDGELVGIHGRAETDAILTEQKDIAVKTGNNQAIPISFYGKTVEASVADSGVERSIKTLPPLQLETPESIASQSRSSVSSIFADSLSVTDAFTQSRLKEVPGFVLARQDGQPLTITTKDKDGKPEATLLPVYMVPKAAEESLKNLQTSNPQLGREARILVVSLAQVQALFMEAVKKDPKFAILLTPDQTQMQTAVPILKAQGLTDDDIKKLGMFVPVFFSEITLTVPDASGKPKVVAPFFFEFQAAANIIENARQQNPALARVKVQAAPLSAILQQLKEAKPDSSWADVQLIPTEDAIAFARKLQGNSGQNSSSASSAGK